MAAESKTHAQRRVHGVGAARAAVAALAAVLSGAAFAWVAAAGPAAADGLPVAPTSNAPSAAETSPADAASAATSTTAAAAPADPVAPPDLAVTPTSTATESPTAPPTDGATPGQGTPAPSSPNPSAKGEPVKEQAPTAAAAVAADPPITVGCVGTTSGTTFTLTADCTTTAPLSVPDGFTVDGAGHTISATDAGGPQWNGAILTNEGSSMTIRNLTITGPAGGFQLCTNSTNVLYGIFFNDASGTVTNVTVDHVFQQQNGLFASCQTGRAIRADGTAPRTVTITGTTVRDYQKSGFEARGAMTMNLTASIAGPPHPLEGLIAQNGVSFVNTTTGTVADNTMIHGSSDQAPGPPGCGNCAPTNGTALLLFNADNLTVTRNTFVGLGTDIGVAVSAGSTGNTISFNNVTRTDSQNPANTDPTGIGISVDPGNTATLICNTFSGWNTNIVGAIQIDCTPLPDGAECQAYSAHTPTVEGGAPPFSWSFESGSLPPGLTLATDGAITGTPTTAAKFDFTLRASDATQLTATQAQSITIAPDCQTPTPTPTPTPTTPTMTPISQVPPGESGALAATGPATGLVDTLIAGVLLLATGLTLTAFAARRRRSAAGRPDPTSSSLDDGYIE